VAIQRSSYTQLAQMVFCLDYVNKSGCKTKLMLFHFIFSMLSAHVNETRNCRNINLCKVRQYATISSKNQQYADTDTDTYYASEQRKNTKPSCKWHKHCRDVNSELPSKVSPIPFIYEAGKQF
jgi:hypothetical protein